jgi:hypothetical protein
MSGVEALDMSNTRIRTMNRKQRRAAKLPAEPTERFFGVQVSQRMQEAFSPDKIKWLVESSSRHIIENQGFHTAGYTSSVIKDRRFDFVEIFFALSWDGEDSILCFYDEVVVPEIRATLDAIPYPSEIS